MNFKYDATHDFLVGNRECNTERSFKNQLYIELGLHRECGLPSHQYIALLQQPLFKNFLSSIESIVRRQYYTSVLRPQNDCMLVHCSGAVKLSAVCCSAAALAQLLLLHSGSKRLKSSENKFIQSGFTSFSMQVSANSNTQLPFPVMACRKSQCSVPFCCCPSIAAAAAAVAQCFQKAKILRK